MRGPRIEFVGTFCIDENGKFSLPIPVGKGAEREIIRVPIAFSKEGTEKQLLEPVHVSPALWVFRNKVLHVSNEEPFTSEELLLHIRHFVLRSEGKLTRMKREIGAFENMERLPGARRERIAESVRLFVWQIDEGKCVQCGHKENLEFDHIIPLAEGGSNTERNIQLLCEACNRSKGKSI